VFEFSFPYPKRQQLLFSMIHNHPSKESDMNAIRHTTLMLSLAAALALPNVVRAEDAATAAPASAKTVTTAPAPAQTAPATMPGMGMGMGMGPGAGMGPGMAMQHGAMHGEHCNTNKGGTLGAGKPCMTGQDCRMGGADAMTEKRLDMLEKRVDMMQMVLEMMMQQSSSDSQ
jgi:hypothetical protein